MTRGANNSNKGNGPRWEAILAIGEWDRILGMSCFRLLKKLERDDICSVYLFKLGGTRCYFAMKMMDKASLANR